MSDCQNPDILSLRIKESMEYFLPEPMTWEAPIKGMRLVRKDACSVRESCITQPLFGIVIQGIKHSVTGSRSVTYRANQGILSGIDLPVSSCIVDASPDNPFYFIYFQLDMVLVSELMLDMPEPVKDEDGSTCLAVGDVGPEILDVLLRMLRAIRKPEQLKVLAPLLLRELYYFLLTSSTGKNLWLFNTPGSVDNQVILAAQYLRDNYGKKINIDELCKYYGMSRASFHRNFKRLTGSSPIQYQKQFRLHKARQLLIIRHMKSSEAAYAVGYESVTQFTREYKRFFGFTPLKDMQRLQGRAK